MAGQAVVMMILDPIYNQGGIFQGFSYGFRPGTRAHQAPPALTVSTSQYPAGWVAGGDICKFFDNVDKDKLIELLEKRIGDKRVIRLIRKWLNAGVMVDGVKEFRERGTPQGAVISPILANVYLHYGPRSWFHAWRQSSARGRMSMVRYADDFVVTAQYKDDVEAFLADLKQRLAGFSLELHSEKTRLLEFGKYAAQNSRRRGKKKPETFNFLGMTHYLLYTDS